MSVMASSPGAGHGLVAMTGRIMGHAGHRLDLQGPRLALQGPLGLAGSAPFGLSRMPIFLSSQKVLQAGPKLPSKTF
jgi:hypothetical protein